MDDDNDVRFCTRQKHSELALHTTSSLKQQCTDKHVPHSNTLTWFLATQVLHLFLNAVCLDEKQHIPILSIFRFRGKQAHQHNTNIVYLIWLSILLTLSLPNELN